MSAHQWPDAIPAHATDCLIRWPEGTVGFHEEQHVIRLLNSLCVSQGYGRIPQLTAQLEDLWRNPERIAHYEEEQRAHNARMAEGRAIAKALEEDE